MFKKLAKQLHAKLDSYLKKEIIKPKGGNISVINYTKESIYNGLTPERLANILIAFKEGYSREFLILAEEFEEKDPHFISTISVRKKALLTVEPSLFTSEVNNKQAIKLAEEFINQPFFSNLVMDLLDAVSKGFSVCEMLWQNNVVVGYKHLPAYWFGYDNFNQLKLWNDLGTELKPIIEDNQGAFLHKKFIIHQPKSKSGLQIRSGVILPASIYLLFKAYAMKDFIAFAESFGMPLRLGKYDNEPTDKDISTLKKAVANLGVDAAAIIPKSMEIEFHEVNKGDGSKLYCELLDYIDKQVSKLILGQTMTTDNGSSMAQAKVHNEIRLDIVKSDAKELEVTLNRFLESYINQVIGILEVYPKIRWNIEEEEDRKALADIATKALTIGLPLSKSDLYDRLKLKEPNNNEDTLPPLPALVVAANTNNEVDKNNTILPNTDRAQSRLQLNQEESEVLDDGLDELQTIVITDKKLDAIETNLVEPVLKIIEEAKDYDDLQEKLISIKLNSSNLQNNLQEVTTASKIAGEQRDKI